MDKWVREKRFLDNKKSLSSQGVNKVGLLDAEGYERYL
jgi:hypothetical protein